jgi:NAD(P)-dependent dehydrogenase (short-subunit alcohol dehydrogenase family)
MKPAPVVLITGAETGLVYFTAFAFTQAGYCIMATDLHAERRAAVLVAR